MISENLRDNLIELKLICCSNPKIQKSLIKKSNDSLIAAICEIAHNLCVGKIDVSDEQRRQLRKYKKELEFLASVEHLGVNCKREKKVLNQKGGGFLSLMLEPALDLISDQFLDD